MKWQSIETAPKDRTTILAWNGKFVSEALWEPDSDDKGHVGWCYSTFYNFECYGNYNNSYDEDRQPTLDASSKRTRRCIRRFVNKR